jgi:TetR/AcrR family transcriptional repressor of nem operon
MARTKEFDPDEVLDSAMRLFWRQGYKATSIHDLVDATGINRASMYARFGGKEALFAAALDHYVDRISRDRLAQLSAEGSARKALERYFNALIRFSIGEGRDLGCLLINTAVEAAARNPDLDAKLLDVFDRVEKTFREVIRRGQANGEISRNHGPTALARFLMSTVHGLRVQARFKPDEKHLRDTVRVALSVLD